MNFFTLIKKNTIHPAPKKKVIPAKEFSTLVDAAQIIDEVKKEEQTFRLQITKECEKLKEIAQKEGFEEGLKQWNAQIVFLENEIRKVREEVEASMTPLTLAAVKKIIGKELKTNPNVIVDIIANAVKTVSHHRRITLYVNQAELDRIEAERSRIKKLFEHLESLTITARDDVAEGGCMIETEAGIINAQLDSQLDALEAALHVFFQNHKMSS